MSVEDDSGLYDIRVAQSHGKLTSITFLKSQPFIQYF